MDLKRRVLELEKELLEAAGPDSPAKSILEGVLDCLLEIVDRAGLEEEFLEVLGGEVREE